MGDPGLEEDVSNDPYIHALRRYPGVPPQLAIQMLMSDRQTAGLGALAEEKRRQRGGGWRYAKYFEPLQGGTIVYRMSFYRPAAVRAAPFQPVWAGPRYAQTTMRKVVDSEITLAIKHVALPYELTVQDARDRLAWRLRGKRAELRAAVNRERGQ